MATASAALVAPVTLPGGNPVIAAPGLTPRLPLRTLGPVFVTVEPPSTTKLPAVPRPTGGWAAAAAAGRPGVREHDGPSSEGLPAAGQQSRERHSAKSRGGAGPSGRPRHDALPDEC